MLRSIRTVVFLASCCLLLQSCNESKRFAVLDGESVDLLTEERTIFINYWAVWCTPCIEEMPILAEFREKHIEDVEVYAVNFDAPPSGQLRDQIAQLKVRIPSLLEDPGPLFGQERPQALPTTLVIKNGSIVEILLGPQTLESLENNL